MGGKGSGRKKKSFGLPIGLNSWVNDYKQARSYSNVKLAKQIKGKY